MLVATLAQIPVRVGYVGRSIGVGYAGWLRGTVLPTLVPGAVGGAAALLVHASMADVWPRYLAVGLTYGLVALPLMWMLSVGEREKNSLRRLASSAMPRALRRFAPRA
jgi:hypothetical protein